MREKRQWVGPEGAGAGRRQALCGRDASQVEAWADVVRVLTRENVPFVLGGAYATGHYTGLYRQTKDLDLFLRKEDAERALNVLGANGFRPDRADPAWIYKAWRGEHFVDLIFSSGNGVATVDDAWFDHAPVGEVFGLAVLVAPPEEILLSKAFVLERERYDGADINHLLLACADGLDWPRLLERFDRYWEVLFSHLLLFRFAYPSERSRVPDWVMAELMTRTLHGMREGDWVERVCRGPLLSRVSYQVDVREHGYRNGRHWDEDDRDARGGTT